MSACELGTHPVDWIAVVLVLVGAANWGLIGFGGLVNAHGNVVDVAFAFVEMLGGPADLLESLVYIAIGIAGLYLVVQVYRR